MNSADPPPQPLVCNKLKAYQKCMRVVVQYADIRRRVANGRVFDYFPVFLVVVVVDPGD